MIDRQSDTWLEVEKSINNMLNKHRKKLEIQGVSIEETEFLRGSIQSLNKILSIDDDIEPIIKKDNSYN